MSNLLEQVQKRVKENQEFISWQCKQQADWAIMLRHLTDRF